MKYQFLLLFLLTSTFITPSSAETDIDTLLNEYRDALDRQKKVNEKLLKKLDEVNGILDELHEKYPCRFRSSAGETPPSIRSISEFSATPSEIRNVMCKQNIDMEFYLGLVDLYEEKSQKEDAQKEDRTIMGIEFVNQPKFLLDTFEELVTPVETIFNKIEAANIEKGSHNHEAITFLEDYRKSLLTQINGNIVSYNEPKPIQNLNESVPRDCHQVRCALKGIFKERWDEVLVLSQAFGLNTSEFAGHKAIGNQHVSAWTEEELQTILSALSNMRTFPTSQVFEGMTMQRLDRDPLLEMNNNGKIGNATLLFYNELDRLPPEQRESMIFHEFSHLLSGYLIESDDKLVNEWKELTGWGRGSVNKEPSDYASVAWNEDLAESIVSFRYSGEFLKQRSPERYDFVKEHFFEGQEFINEKDCEEFESFRKAYEGWSKRISGE